MLREPHDLFFYADDHWHAWAGSRVIFALRDALRRDHRTKAAKIIDAFRDHRLLRGAERNLIALWVGHGPPPGFPCFHVTSDRPLSSQMPDTLALDREAKEGRPLTQLFVSLAHDLGPEDTLAACIRFHELYRRYGIRCLGMWLTADQLKWGAHCDWSKITTSARELRLPPHCATPLYMIP